MITVLTGTNPYGFDRLIKYVDTELGKKYNIFIQTGASSFTPKNSQFRDYLHTADYERRLSKSDLVITQGGYGGIMTALLAGKKIISVPRYPELSECKDNQVELVKYFEEKEYLIACYDIQNLAELVLKILNGEWIPKPYLFSAPRLVHEEIQRYINECD